MEKILITGSNGLLGQKLVYKLVESAKFEVYASSKGDNRIVMKSGYNYIDLDICDQNQLENVFEMLNPQIVINTAAMTNVDACEDEQDEAEKLNYQAVANMADLCKKHNSFLIQLSTDFVFDGQNGPYSESDPTNPLSFYGQTKLRAEEYIKSNLANYSILRTILVYGIVDDMSRTNIVLWAKSSLESGRELNIVDDQYRMPTLAEDLADACILSAESKIKGVFHVSGKDFMSIYEIVERVAKFWNLDMSLVNRTSSLSLNQKAKRPVVTGFKLSKAMGILGYQPHSFEQGLEILSKQMLKK